MPSSPHRAIVDDNGNIVLPGEMITRAVAEAFEEETIDPAPMKVEETPAEEDEEIVDWTATNLEEALEEAAAPQPEESRARPVFSELREQMLAVTAMAVDEGVRQYSATLREGKTLWRRALSDFAAFLMQPVWVPARRNQVKQYKRSTLFALDMLRFGGTFASLFLGLFVVLNYQSFWEIAKAHIDPLSDIKASVMAASGKGRDLVSAFKTSSLAHADGDLLSLVPPVGPPQNLLVIPKLNLTVPVQTPPSDSLLKENWTQLEQDIQASLVSGVVHYPGTARPGQAGNVFITGHSSYFPWAEGEYKSVFARLHTLEPGDEYWVFYGGDKFRYIVQEKKEVRPSDVSVLDQPIQKRTSTLMTCSPVGTTLRRLIITAQEVDPTTGLALDVGEHAKRAELPKVRAEMLPI